jgi:nidogen (entactin)
MQLLALAGSLFLVIYSVAAQGTDKVGPCDKARQDAGTPMPGNFIPACTEFGFFKPTQCHGSTGKCWCVNPDTGKEIEGSSTFRTGPPQCTMCFIKRADALRPAGFVGHYAPTCDEEGLFAPTQVYGSTGQSWCVNKYTGEEIPDTRVGPGQERKIKCETASHLIGLSMHSKLIEQGPCYAKILESRGREGTPGFFTPRCTDNGYYKTEQYHSSTGFSWCVNPATGEEVVGTRRAPGQPKATCGACFKEIDDKLNRHLRLGNYLAQCNEENGDYLPVQYHEGYTWCANPKTGAVEGQKYQIIASKKISLPCVNN